MSAQPRSELEGPGCPSAVLSTPSRKWHFPDSPGRALQPAWKPGAPRAGAAGRAARCSADKAIAKHFNVVFLLERVSEEKAWRILWQQLVAPWGGDVRLLGAPKANGL